MVLSLSVGAFAAETGTITITNATIGESYAVYKIFDATYNADGDVSYTIDPDNNQFFDDLFGVDGTTSNTYFIYEAGTHGVKKNEANTFTDKQMFDYLSSLLASATPVQTKNNVTSKEVKFESLTPGYYVIERQGGTANAVTITTNKPNATVIDKNQKPNAEDSFSKLVWDEDYTGADAETRVDEYGNTLTGKWVSSSTANIGDIIDWKINFTATNYDGENIVMYYSIRDTKSPSLWVEFTDVAVSVGGTDLPRGYYFFAGPDGDPADTGEWEYLGDWTGVTQNPQNAQWYLIHYGYNDFEIVIPWLDDFTFTGDATQNTYELTFDLDEKDGNTILSEPKYDSPAEVVLTYSAAVGPDAANTTSQNSAKLHWTTPEGTSGPDDSEVTTTKAFNLGITKIANDGTSTTPATRLAGAVFELYKDEACTDPIYVIPTGVTGVYILDDVDTIATGEKRTTAREKYTGKWETYIIDDPKPETTSDVDADKQKDNRRNDMETPDNGQLVIMGLESGTYYMLETKAPEGYNQLDDPVPVTVGTGATTTYDNGYVVYSTPIQNNSGIELPSTGGEGTIMLITFGSLIAMAFAVLMITQKKMSVYHD